MTIPVNIQMPPPEQFSPYNIVITVNNAVAEDVLWVLSFMDAEVKAKFPGDYLAATEAVELLYAIRGLLSMVKK